MGVGIGLLVFALGNHYVSNLPDEDDKFIFKNTKREFIIEESPDDVEQIKKRMTMIAEQMKRDSTVYNRWHSITITTTSFPLEQEKEETIDTLKEKLKKAIDDEDYVEAAKLRDKIKTKTK